MTKEEFKKRMEEEEDWAPGWDAIEAAFEKLYPDQKPVHYGTEMNERAMFGGDQYLDGYSIYESPHGYKHIVTFGMTELYAEEAAFGGEWNKWGYEMTIKLAEKENQDCVWALDMFSNLALYTYTQKRYFEPFQYVAGNGSSICLNRESQITALLIVPDTELPPIDTVYGKTEFIQLVGITESELSKLKEDSENARLLYKLMKEENPYLITDLNRKGSYL